MKTNEDRSIILIENPFTGNDSVAKALRLAENPTSKKWALPSDARKKFTPEEWRAAKKIVMVRDPKARFESAATFAVVRGYSEDNHPEFNGLLLSVMDLPAAQKGKLFLEFLGEHMEQVPAYLRPQNAWLTCKFDVVLGTSNIAEYFNKEVGKCCVRSNNFRSNPAFKSSHVTADQGLLEKVYAEDFALFEKLKLWSPSPTEIRLVSGPCKRCMQDAGKFSSLIDPTQLGEPESSYNEEVEVLHERAIAEIPKVRRRRKPDEVVEDIENIDTGDAEE